MKEETPNSNEHPLEPLVRRLPNKHDFDGACKPGASTFSSNTFSVGVFKWIPTKDGKRLKRSRVIKRIRGYVSNAQEVYNKANKLCDELDRQSA